MKRLLAPALLGAGLAQVQAETLLYHYRDAQGTVHLANQPLDARYRPFVPRAAPQAPAPDPAVGLSAPAVPFAGRLGSLVDAAAVRHGIEARLLHAIIAVESAYRPGAVSPKGAIGLMQLMPGTAARFGVHDLKDPAQNLAAGARYLRFLLERFSGNLPLVLAAYNAGEGAIARFGNAIPPFPETRNYVTRVLTRYRALAPEQPSGGVRQVLVIEAGLPARTERW